MSHLADTHRRPLAVVLAAVAFALVSMLVAAPAEAYTISQRSGVPVLPTIYKVQGTHANIGSEITGPMWQARLYQPGPIAQRTAQGDQTVRVTYRVYTWNGSTWSLKATRTGSAQIPSSQVSVRLPQLSYAPGNAGYYSVQVDLTWSSALGAIQGSMRTSMNHQADYSCNTTQICQTGPGWVYLH